MAVTIVRFEDTGNGMVDVSITFENGVTPNDVMTPSQAMAMKLLQKLGDDDEVKVHSIEGGEE